MKKEILISKENGLLRFRIYDEAKNHVLTMHVLNSGTDNATSIYFPEPNQIEIVDLENEIIETPEKQNA